MIPDHDLEVILTAAIVDLDPDLALEVIKGNLIHDQEAVPLPYLEDKDPHLSLTSGELQVHVNDLFHIREKQDFTMKIAPPALLAVRVAEVIGVGVEAEVAAGHDHTQDHQGLHQNRGLVLEAHTEVVTEVEEVLICGRKDGPQEAEADH